MFISIVLRNIYHYVYDTYEHIHCTPDYIHLQHKMLSSWMFKNCPLSYMCDSKTIENLLFGATVYKKDFNYCRKLLALHQALTSSSFAILRLSKLYSMLDVTNAHFSGVEEILTEIKSRCSHTNLRQLQCFYFSEKFVDLLPSHTTVGCTNLVKYIWKDFLAACDAIRLNYSASLPEEDIIHALTYALRKGRYAYAAIVWMLIRNKPTCVPRVMILSEHSSCHVNGLVNYSGFPFATTPLPDSNKTVPSLLESCQLVISREIRSLPGKDLPKKIIEAISFEIIIPMKFDVYPT